MYYQVLKNTNLEQQHFEEELNKTKYCLANTKELLNESDLENIRLNEQITLLKEEIRRIERNVDRVESMTNLEYLKNIILKFFMLKTTPERLQLIPVLVTILKLSPNEEIQLVHIVNSTIIMKETLTKRIKFQQTVGGHSPLLF